ncbi:protein of unknown function [Methylorubrum extorquens]|uniref:Uncharacterized protein n=1 Tax=Methylorubrum extorquens TaxID=408 RepID=A0A2N9AQK0_METEX|nr:protein of unknown function [Methylorubrum extorquens]
MENVGSQASRLLVELRERNSHVSVNNSNFIWTICQGARQEEFKSICLHKLSPAPLNSQSDNIGSIFFRDPRHSRM